MYKLSGRMLRNCHRPVNMQLIAFFFKYTIDLSIKTDNLRETHCSCLGCFWWINDGSCRSVRAFSKYPGEVEDCGLRGEVLDAVSFSCGNKRVALATRPEEPVESCRNLSGSHRFAP